MGMKYEQFYCLYKWVIYAHKRTIYTNFLNIMFIYLQVFVLSPIFFCASKKRGKRKKGRISYIMINEL